MTESPRGVTAVACHVGAGIVASLPSVALVAVLAATKPPPAVGPGAPAAAARLTVWVICLASVVGLLPTLRKGRWLSWALCGGVIGAVSAATAGAAVPLAVAAALLGVTAGTLADRLLATGRRTVLELAALVGILLVIVVSASRALARGADGIPNPKRIILICIDTLRADRFDDRGRLAMPVLTAVANDEAVRFSSTYASSSWTLPSVGSMMTSRHPPEHGAEDRGQRLIPDLQTLAGQLSAGGWLSAAFVTHIYVSSLFGFDAGFLEFKEMSIDWSFREGSQPRADEVNRAVIPWIAHHADDPFFLYVHLFDPHWDYDPPPPFDRLFTDPEYTGPANGSFRYLQQFLPTDVLMPAADLRHVEDLYDGEVAWTDFQLGVLFDALRDHGLWDDTLLVVTSDHGEEFQEHGSVHHIRTLYEEVLRVPLLIKLPGGRRGWVRPVVSERVRLIDLAPTVLELAGAPPIDGARGKSLLPLLAAPGEDRPVFAHTIRHHSDKAALIRGSTKTIVQYAPGRESVEIYDLVRDPNERSPLLPSSNPNAVRRARTEVLDMLDTMRSRRSLAPPEVTLTPEQRQHLEALGYLDDDPDEPPEPR